MTNGFLGKVVGSVRAAFGSGSADATAVQAAAPLDALLQPFADKVCSAADAVQLVCPGAHVFVGTACATPRALVAALEALPNPPAGVELLHFLTDKAMALDASGQPKTAYRHRSLFVGLDMRAAVKHGLADYVPMSLVRVPELMARGRIAVDVAFIQVSLPDAFGYVSLGVSVDVVAAAVARASIVIAEVNPAMPRTLGDSMLHVSRITHLVPVDTPVIEYLHPAQPSQAMERIARYISSLIDDGSTLQIGLGRFANEALKYLSDRKDLGVHSDVITEAIIPLLEKGVITGSRKTHTTGKIVTSFAMGTRRLYDLIDNNPLFVFRPLEAVCDPVTLAAQYKLVSVTQAFAIDLTGQVCADQFQGEFYGGVAAQAEFLQSASRSAGGKAIVCLASTDDNQVSRIRAQLLPGEGVTVARNDVHYVVTEYGVAYLFGKSIRERAVALIQIAHPDSREALLGQAQALGYVLPEQKLRNRHAYAVEDEHDAQLKDQRRVLVRPATSSDADGVRQLFHHMPAQDVVKRFFQRIRRLSDTDVQRLCNIDYENEVALVAVTGSREQPEIVGHAMYVMEPSTNIAETAFIIHPAWQGVGLGGVLQSQLADHAKKHGVRGFMAEILSTNKNMIRLAQSGATHVSKENMDGSVRITTLF